MKKIFLIMLSLFLLISAASCKNNDNDNNDSDNNTNENNGENTEDSFMADEKIISNMNLYIDSLITATPSYTPAWNMEGFKGRWNYIDGVFLNSIVELYNQTNDTKYKDFLVRYVNYYIDEFGDFSLGDFISEEDF